MKIAIALSDQSFTRTKSMGIFNVSMGLTRGLMQHPEVTELHILGNNECGDTFRDCPPHVHLHLMDKPVPRRFARVWWDQFGLSSAVRRISPDWLILPKGFPPLFPCLGKTKLACYVHDVMWEYYKKLGKKGLNPFPWYENHYFSHLGKKALKNSDLVLTSTQFNATRFRAHVPTSRIAVIGIGFETPNMPHTPPPQRSSNILFYVSPFPHKLTLLGIRRLTAWIQQRKEQNSIRIHCVGHMPPDIPQTSEHWIQHGRTQQDELSELMKNCRAAVYFSAYEGFGMPPVESLRAKLPCACSDIPPIRENIPAEYLFDNLDESSFIRTMNRIFDNTQTPICPTFPTWQEVTNACIQALKNA